MSKHRWYPGTPLPHIDIKVFLGLEKISSWIGRRKKSMNAQLGKTTGQKVNGLCASEQYKNKSPLVQPNTSCGLIWPNLDG